MNTQYTYGVSANRGSRNYMEDRHKIVDNLAVLNPDKAVEDTQFAYFGVYDGHGGDVCSSFITDHLHNDIVSQEEFPSNLPEALTKGITETDNKFAQTHPKLLDDGSTCVCSILEIKNSTPKTIWVCNSGDSRSILIKLKDQEFISKPLSEDHKPGNSKERSRVEANGGTVRQGVVRINIQKEKFSNFFSSFLVLKVLIGFMIL